MGSWSGSTCRNSVDVATIKKSTPRRQELLRLSSIHPESRYGLTKLQPFQRKNRQLWEAGQAARAETQWQANNQHSCGECTLQVHSTLLHINYDTCLHSPLTWVNVVFVHIYELHCVNHLTATESGCQPSKTTARHPLAWSVGSC